MILIRVLMIVKYSNFARNDALFAQNGVNSDKRERERERDARIMSHCHVWIIDSDKLKLEQSSLTLNILFDAKTIQEDCSIFTSFVYKLWFVLAETLRSKINFISPIYFWKLLSWDIRDANDIRRLYRISELANDFLWKLFYEMSDWTQQMEN